MEPKVSIIIPVKKYNPNLRECLEYCLKLDYNNYDIIVLPDEDNKQIANDFQNHARIRVIQTGNIGPSEKRDIAINDTNAEIITFIDDDAYPVSNWLKNAIKNFSNSEIAAVGGPAITPDSDDAMQKASGFVYSSFLASGNYTYRYLIAKQQFVDDYPSCNFIVRKEIIDRIGGFANCFWPGEDTVLCLKITKELNKKIIYAPDVLVYHHRRRLFKEHLKQVGNYGLHRGYFVKKFPETSFRIAYFIPSMFVLWFFFGLIFSFVFDFAKLFFYVPLIIYMFLLFYESFNAGLKYLPLVAAGIFSTHIVYGICFLKGLLSKKLIR